MAKRKVLVLGDSTIDNKVWLGHEKYILFLGANSFLGKVLSLFGSILNFFKPKSVIENLRLQMPDSEFVDRTNDGFTTTDILHGQYRDKVFGIGAHPFFPHEKFYPLDKQSIQDADQIILSVGGNNFREFLLKASVKQGGEIQEIYMKSAYPIVLEKLLKEYKEILLEIVGHKPNANILIVTQYYPAINQEFMPGSNLYSLVKVLGKVIGLGLHSANDTAQHVMKETYSGILQFIAKAPELQNAHVSVVDVTSSLNPNFSVNYVNQIEPSGVGGAHIAKMLKFALEKAPSETKKIYRFLPHFFFEKYIVNSHILTDEINENSDFYPVHPDTMQRSFPLMPKTFLVGIFMIIAAPFYFCTPIGLMSSAWIALLGTFYVYCCTRGEKLYPSNENLKPHMYNFQSPKKESLDPAQDAIVPPLVPSFRKIQASVGFASAEEPDFSEKYDRELSTTFSMRTRQLL